VAHKEYVLGTGIDELERLGVQHNAWQSITTQTWLNAGIRSDSHVLDLGCGPGFTTLDIAKIVGSSGRVLGVDEDSGFVNYLNDLCQKQQLQHVSAVIGNAMELPNHLTQKPSFDFVFIRWVLCWLPHPDRALREVKKVLKPGGRLIIHDYYNWQAMNIAPRSRALTVVVQAAISSFQERLGNVDIAADLLGLLRHTGFTVRNFEVHQMITRGGGQDFRVAWPLTWWRTYIPKLIHKGYLEAKVGQQALTDLSELESNPDHFFFCPPLFEFIVEN